MYKSTCVPVQSFLILLLGSLSTTRFSGLNFDGSDFIGNCRHSRYLNSLGKEWRPSLESCILFFMLLPSIEQYKWRYLRRDILANVSRFKQMISCDVDMSNDMPSITSVPYIYRIAEINFIWYWVNRKSL